MADKMGSENMVSQANELEDHYRIKTFTSNTLPKDLRPKVLANFLNSLRYGNDLFKLIDKDNYFPYYSKYITYLMYKPSVSLSFAMLKDETILAWSMFEGSILHYVWVDKLQQRQGIGMSLIPKNIDSFSHVTNKWINVWIKHFPHARFEPFDR